MGVQAAAGMIHGLGIGLAVGASVMSVAPRWSIYPLGAVAIALLLASYYLEKTSAQTDTHD